MFSILKVSSAAAIVFGLMGCATQGITSQPAQLATDVDGYQPSSNYHRPLAVQPPPTVTGKVGNVGLERVANSDPSFGYHPSPNDRLAVQPPPTVTGNVGSGTSTGSVACVEGEGMTGVSPNARLCP